MVAEAEIKTQEQAAQRRQYETALEPLIAAAAPKIHDANRVLLGLVQELVPSHTEDRRAVPEADRLWYRALGAVTQRYGLTYELVSDHSGRALWLIPHGRSDG